MKAGGGKNVSKSYCGINVCFHSLLGLELDQGTIEPIKSLIH